MVAREEAKVLLARINEVAPQGMECSIGNSPWAEEITFLQCIQEDRNRNVVSQVEAIIELPTHTIDSYTKKPVIDWETGDPIPPHGDYVIRSNVLYSAEALIGKYDTAQEALEAVGDHLRVLDQQSKHRIQRH